MRELTLDEVNEVTGAGWGDAVAVGGAIGGGAAASGAITSGASVGAVGAAAAAGAAVGAALVGAFAVGWVVGTALYEGPISSAIY